MSDSRQSKPRGLLWLMFKLPVYIYRLRLGWLLGHRFLLLTHQGRKTGKIRHTVLEVIRYDKSGRRALAASFRIVSFCPKDRTAKL